MMRDELAARVGTEMDALVQMASEGAEDGACTCVRTCVFVCVRACACV